jgi:hypothetical protein
LLLKLKFAGLIDHGVYGRGLKKLRFLRRPLPVLPPPLRTEHQPRPAGERSSPKSRQSRDHAAEGGAPGAVGVLCAAVFSSTTRYIPIHFKLSNCHIIYLTFYG